jgi:hypothetical protein
MHSFWFHYNKPASQKAGKPQISLHFMKQCHIVDNIICGVPTRGRVQSKRQPQFVMVGRCDTINLEGGVAHVS